MNPLLRHAAFATGLAVLLWVGAGYGLAQPLALVVTALIGAFYLMGAVELHRYRQATRTLATVVAEANESPPDLRAWLARIPASLQNTVRRRIEGEPVGFAGPSLAPYLAGLLVLLGMLGTFVGMVFTLRGTGIALDSATDLQAVRSSLVEPVRGLGLAFGTSIAGVATSAALGLMSALARADRAQAAQSLDSRIATTLRSHSMAQHRETSLALLRQQADAMPAMIEALRALMESMDRQGQASNERLLAGQQAFHDKTEAAYVGLAASVDRSLRDGLRDSARIADETLRPMIEKTLAGIQHATTTLHERLAGSMKAQSDQLADRLESVSSRVAESWATSLAGHERASRGLADHLRATLDGSALAFEQRSADWLVSVGQRHVDWQEHAATALADITHRAATERAAIAEAAATHLVDVSDRLDRAHVERQAAADVREAQRADAMGHALERLASTLRDEWRSAGEHTIEQQRRLSDAAMQAAADLVARAETQTRTTVTEIARLVQVAAEAPRAAAEVIGELRGRLDDSRARDDALLEERGRMLATVGTLLDGVNHAALEQRSAIDALVESSASMLERVGRRFDEQSDAGASRLSAAAAQVSGSAVEVASLGEAFGYAVQLFSESNDTLVSQLQRIEGALDKSLSRSDEQLAYYVAQAREVVDLSILSQRQIIEDLQRLSGPTASASAPAETAA